MASGAYLKGQMLLSLPLPPPSCWKRTSPRRGATYVSEQITTGRTKVVNCAGPTRGDNGGRGGEELRGTRSCAGYGKLIRNHVEEIALKCANAASSTRHWERGDRAESREE